MFLYKITNKINEKSYVGFTSTTPTSRWYQHCANAYKKNRRSKLYSAMRKYGKDSFSLEEIYQGNDALEKEQYFIEFFNSEYNMTKGGEANRLGIKGYKLSEETKQKMRKPKTKPRTAEHILKISLAQKGKIPWNKGKKGSTSNKWKGLRDSSRTANWKIKFMNGTIIKTRNLVLWCENNGYNTNSLKGKYYANRLPHLDIKQIEKL